MTLRRLAAVAAVALAGVAAPALAHHGGAAVGAIGVEAPGAALETTSPFPLGKGTLYALAKAEYVPLRQRDGLREQKRYALYDTLALGLGLTDWLSLYAFQPYNVKAQDGVGTNAGLGDTNLMLALSLKWDEGLRLVPERESLDELEDWHLGLWAACSLPVGPTARRDDAGEPFAPDMQTGFAGPSPSMGLSVLKQISPALTLLGEVSHQRFLEREYPEAGYRYGFGAETRVNAAAVLRLLARDGARLDLAPELSLLDLRRDRSDEGTGALAALEASGGTILYGQLGLRGTIGSFTAALGVKRAVARALNEGSEQQGSEGLETVRASLVLGWSHRVF